MATLTKQNFVTAVAPNGLTAARRKAVELATAAYSPQPVPQPDGSTLRLCWNGRIARGYELLAAARIAKDAARIDVLQKALANLTERRIETAQAAEDAASTWAAMAAAGGVTVDPNEVYPAECQCEGCRMQHAWHDHNTARGAYSDALYALLAPNSHDTPPLLEILATANEESQRDRLWVHLKRIRDAAATYVAACKAADTHPNWRAAMFPGEEL